MMPSTGLITKVKNIFRDSTKPIGAATAQSTTHISNKNTKIQKVGKIAYISEADLWTWEITSSIGKVINNFIRSFLVLFRNHHIERLALSTDMISYTPARTADLATNVRNRSQSSPDMTLLGYRYVKINRGRPSLSLLLQGGQASHPWQAKPLPHTMPGAKYRHIRTSSQDQGHPAKAHIGPNILLLKSLK